MGKHTLPPLPYGYDALEPAISREIMELHHDKHHQVYVNGLNAAEEAYAAAEANGDVAKKIELQAALKFHGGGHINHSLFWKNLAPTGSDETKLQPGAFADAINRDFGSLDELKTKFNAATAAIQGSGWGWLTSSSPSSSSPGKLSIVTTKDQDPVINGKPIIGVDIWEHAFYLQYKNVKADYLKAIWSVINFTEAANRYQQSQA